MIKRQGYSVGKTERRWELLGDVFHLKLEKGAISAFDYGSELT